LKLPAVRLRRTGNLRNVRKRFHFIVVRSLTPQLAAGNTLAEALSKRCGDTGTPRRGEITNLTPNAQGDLNDFNDFYGFYDLPFTFRRLQFDELKNLLIDE